MAAAGLLVGHRIRKSLARQATRCKLWDVTLAEDSPAQPLDTLVDAISAACPKSPVEAQLLVLVPSSSIAREVRQRLVERRLALLGVHVLSPRALIARVTAVEQRRTAQRIGRVLVEDWLERVAADRLSDVMLSQDDRSELRYLSLHQGARVRLASTLLSIRRYEAGYGTTFAPVTSGGRLLSGLLQDLALRIESAGCRDDADELMHAMRCLREHGLSRAFEPEARVIAYIQREREDVESFGLLAAMAEHGVSITAVPIVSTDRHPASSAYAALPKVTGAARFRSFHARGREAEVSEACVRARDLIRDGVRPDRIAFVALDPRRYDGILQVVAAREDLPLARDTQLPSATMPACSLALRILRIACADAPRSEVLAAFSHSALAHDGVDATTLERALAHFDSKSREMLCHGGFDLLSDFLQEHPISHAAASEAWTLLTKTFGAWRNLAARLTGAQSNREHGDAMHEAFRATIAGYDRPAPGAGTEALFQAVEDLTVRDRFALGPCPIDTGTTDSGTDLVSAIRARLRGRPSASVARGVAWLGLDEVHGRDFDAVFVLGLERGASLEKRGEAKALRKGIEASDLDAWRRAIAARIERRDAAKKSILDSFRPRSNEEEQATLVASLHDLLQAARHSVTVSFCRADDLGRPLGASPWIGAIAEAMGKPRSTHELFADTKVHDAVPWTPGRRYQALCAASRSPSSADILHLAGLQGGWRRLQETAQRIPTGFATDLVASTRWIRSVDRFDDDERDAHSFDAWQLGPTSLATVGVSPTAFEKLESCPLQFYFLAVIGARALRTEPSWESSSKLDLGRVAHAVLEHVYQQVFAADLDLEERVALAKDLVAQEVKEHDKDFVSPMERRYKILGDVTRQRWTTALQAFVVADLHDLAQRGLRPRDLEVQVQSTIELPTLRVTLRGKIDRIDFDDDGDARIVDYKTGKAIAQKDKRDTQLALYCLMIEVDRGLRATASFLGIAPQHYRDFAGALPERRLDPRFWDEIEARKQALADTAEPLRSGTYLPRKKTPFPCDYCDFRASCPRHHVPTLTRLGLEVSE